MKKYMILISLIGQLMACSTVKRQMERKKTASERQIALQAQDWSAAKMQQLWVDSEHTSVEVVFWPKGQVKYSPANGFEGQASKITLRSSEKKQQQLSQKQKILQRSGIAYSAQQQESKTTKNTTKAKQGIPLMLKLGLLFLMVLGLGYFVYKLKRKYTEKVRPL